MAPSHGKQCANHLLSVADPLGGERRCRYTEECCIALHCYTLAWNIKMQTLNSFKNVQTHVSKMCLDWKLATSYFFPTMSTSPNRFLLFSPIKVLPVPGGPKSRIPLGGRLSPVKMSGLSNGHTTASWITDFACSSPAMSSHPENSLNYRYLT